MSKAYPPHVRYLPVRVTMLVRDDWSGRDLHTEYFPGFVDVRAYPELARYTVPASEAPA